MKTTLEFKIEERESRNKGSARSLRRAGKVPAIIYGNKKKPMNFSIEEKEIRKEYTKGGFFSKVICLNVGNKKINAIAKEIQLNHITDIVEHADFLFIDEKTEITVRVPVIFQNRDKSIGLRRGGALNIVRHYLELICLPNNIPSNITIDISKTTIGDSIHISNIALPKGTRSVIDDRDYTVATITGRKASEETETEEENEENE